MIRLGAIFTSAMLIISAGRAEPQDAPSSPKDTLVDFSRDILPILSNNCFTCHGPADKKAGLRLDQRDQAIRKTRSGAMPIVPGKASTSEVIRRIGATDAAERMPPVKSGKVLTAADKDLLAKWIDQGAEYKVHWAFVKPVRPGVPQVKHPDWVRNEIDAFILDRLDKTGLKPAPRADKTTLIRRLSLDLRGVPPSLQEVDAFLADSQPQAYERLVDRMLASPRYGEKMALLWLDLARFGDTSGFENDSTRQMWLWRDWVIEAFNKNMPFDEFTIQQLAGDLLPGAGIPHKIASGFNRNTRFNEENGADPEEFVIRYNVDRTNTLGQVWLGMTLGCAECHSHKYDPISQKEYYQLFAYFTGIKEPEKTGLHNVPLPPILKMPSAVQAKTMAKLEKEQARLQDAIDKKLAKVTYRDPYQGQVDTAKTLATMQDGVWFADELPGSAKVEAKEAPSWQWAVAPQPLEGAQERGTALQRSPGRYRGLALPPPRLPRLAMVRSGAGLHQHRFSGATQSMFVSPGDKLFVHVYLDPKNPPQAIMLEFDDGTREHRAYWGADKCLLAGTPNGPQHFKAGALPAAGAWARLEIEADKLNLLPDARIRGMAFIQFDGTAYYDKPGLATKYAPDDRYLTSLSFWEPRAKTNTKLPTDVQAALKVEAAQRKPEQVAKIVHHYLRRVCVATRADFEPLEIALDNVAQTIKQTDDTIPYTMISEEMPEPRPAHVLVRGDFLKKGDKVERAVPSIFPALPRGQPNNRLGLARWLMQPDHPLTARVAVNRLWGQMFGTGLVKTIGDFGTQGEQPSHPELLDWLAVDFMSPARGNPWDVQRLLRNIVLSSTYQQSSVVTASAALKVDPYNRLLSRAPRFRLAAEEIRDSVLAIAGLLSAKIGGPSVMPYQPADFYKFKNESWPWTSSPGEDQYRRGMYTFWRRTTLHPMFAIFDAPSREECSVARSRTNTPLQALVTLNDPTFVEAARVFAQKVMTQGPVDVDGRLAYAMRCTVARRPTAAEGQLLKSHYDKNLQRYQANKEAAAKVVQVGLASRPANLDVVELAAWTSVCNILLNLDETITRE